MQHPLFVCRNGGQGILAILFAVIPLYLVVMMNYKTAYLLQHVSPACVIMHASTHLCDNVTCWIKILDFSKKTMQTRFVQQTIT